MERRVYCDHKLARQDNLKARKAQFSCIPRGLVNTNLYPVAALTNALSSVFRHR